jgi:hypothetical protein
VATKSGEDARRAELRKALGRKHPSVEQPAPRTSSSTKVAKGSSLQKGKVVGA